MSGRLIYVATIVAILGVTGGVAVAGAILAPTAVTQVAGMYAGQNSPPNGFAATPTLSISNTPGSVAACTSAPVTEGASAATTDIYFANSTGGTGCKTGNFAELFVISFSETLTSAQTDKISVTTSWGSPATTGYNSVSVTTGASTGAYTQTIDVFVDYNSPSMPAGGIDTLTLVIQ